MGVPTDMPSRVRLSVDCMGGDHGPAVTLQACRAFVESHADAELLLVGTPQALQAAASFPRCTLVPASEVVAMDDPVEVALRRKKDSSMRVAIAQVKPGEGTAAAADACISAGNTGALMAVARYVLKTLDGIDRPAIATVMPNRRGGHTTVLDLGANVDCSAEHLLQFALMGSALVSAGELLRQAHDAGRLRFHGNVEGNDIFKGTTDIVVCDGFVGNVLLKTSEGLASMLGEFIREEFTRGPGSRLAALVALPVLRRFKDRVDHRRYNGAALLGLRGLVFKSHGSADAYAFEQALCRAYDAARNGLLQRVQSRIAESLGPAQATAPTPAPSS
jgi:glycerol-3-phosphate acyltransferase PlsX